MELLNALSGLLFLIVVVLVTVRPQRKYKAVGEAPLCGDTYELGRFFTFRGAKRAADKFAAKDHRLFTAAVREGTEEKWRIVYDIGTI